MNQVYSVIVNRHLGVAQVVSELATGRKKSSTAKGLAKFVQVGVVGAALGMGMPVWAADLDTELLVTEGDTHTVTGSLNLGSVSTSKGTVRIRDNDSHLTVGENLSVGQRGEGELSVSASGTTTVTNDMTIGELSTAKGTVSIQDSGSSLNVGGKLVVGSFGKGDLSVSAGGAVAVAESMTIGNSVNSEGKVSVQDSDSSLTVEKSLMVGNNGKGDLTVSRGGTVTVAENMTLGMSGSAEGTVSIKDNGSKLIAEKDLYVGFFSKGDLSVSAGGTVAVAKNMTLGMIGGAVGTFSIKDSGSSLTVGGYLFVGDAGQGELSVSNGGLVKAGSLSIGKNGKVLLSGAGNARGVLDIGGFASASGGMVFDGGELRASNNFTLDVGSLQVGTNGAFINTNAFNVYIATGIKMQDPAQTSGGLTKLGSGTLTLSGVNDYQGRTSVEEGTLNVNGRLTNSGVLVNNGAKLGGTGSVLDADIHAGGTLISQGLTVNNNLTLSAGSVFEVTMGPAAPVPMKVHGKTTILAGTVNVIAQDVNYQGADSHLLLSSTGGVTGTFANVKSDFAFLTTSLSYTANDVFLKLARNSTNFVDVAQNPNQYAVAAALDQAGTTATGDMGSIITTFTGLSTDQALTGLTTMSGASYTQIQTIGTSFANTFGDQMQGRLQVLGAYGPDFTFAANDTGSERFTLAGGIPTTSSQQPGFWVRGNGNYQRLDDASSPNKTTLKTAGMSAGVDARISRQLVVGAAVSLGETDLRAGMNDEGKSKNAALGAYASYATGPWGVNGNIMVGRSINSMDRSIQVGGINRKAESSFNSNTLSGYGEVTYDIYFDQWTLQPVAGVSVLHARTNAFTEQGAGSVNLNVSSQSRTTGRTMLGTRATFDLGHVLLQPRAIWAHDLGKTNQSLTMQMQGAPTSFTVIGTEQKRDALITGLTLSGQFSKNTMLFADVQGEFKSGSRSYGATLGLRTSW